jgi:amidohydrolase
MVARGATTGLPLVHTCRNDRHVRTPVTALVPLLAVAALTQCAAAARPPALANDVAKVMPAVRRDFEAIHRHPELGKHEVETAKLVRRRLGEMGFRDFVEVKGLPTAVIAVLDSGRPGKTIALRSELDARKAVEKTKLPYASEAPGLMHSCGHDAHAAMLLGAAEVLMARKDTLRGRVVFLFQPAEESPGGADEIVADGVLDRLQVTAMFAQHASPPLPVGEVRISPGPTMAGSNYFTATVHGKGSHAATPAEGGDVVLAAAQLARDLSEYPARHLDLVSHPAVISVTTFNAGDAESLNVLPTEAKFQGTLRTFDDIKAPIGTSPSLFDRLQAYVAASSAAHGVTTQLDLQAASPPTRNDPALYASLIGPLRAHWPAGKLADAPRGMFSEDFSFYTSGRPCLYFSLGVAKDGLGLVSPHSDEFSVHPDALPIGVTLLTTVAMLATGSEL